MTARPLSFPAPARRPWPWSPGSLRPWSLALLLAAGCTAYPVVGERPELPRLSRSLPGLGLFGYAASFDGIKEEAVLGYGRYAKAGWNRETLAAPLPETLAALAPRVRCLNVTLDERPADDRDGPFLGRRIDATLGPVAATPNAIAFAPDRDALIVRVTTSARGRRGIHTGTGTAFVGYLRARAPGGTELLYFYDRPADAARVLAVLHGAPGACAPGWPKE